MARAEPLAADVRGEQEARGGAETEAAAKPGRRGDDNAAGVRREACSVEDGREGDAAPVLDGVPAAGAVEGGAAAAFGEGREFAVVEGARLAHRATDLKPPLVGGDALAVVGKPVGDGVAVAGEAGLLAGAGEAPVGAGLGGGDGQPT